MKYEHIIRGNFINRPNRFVAYVCIDGERVLVHVKNTGRCRELLTENATVYLSVSNNPARKTKYDIVAVEKATPFGVRLINMDSQIVNDVALEHLRELFPQGKIRREVTFKKSRFDFYIEVDGRRIFCEVKGVTLENNGIVSFPDAPTERGVKHINELVSALDEGFEAMILFVVQMEGVKFLTPNDQTHHAFGDALRRASECGVKVMAIDSLVTPDTIIPNKEVEVRL